MSQFISLATAIEMTSLYRNQKENILKTDYQGQNILCTCETFDKSVVEALISQTGCQQLRIYFGMKEDFTVHSILVGVDGNGADILPPQNATLSTSDDDDEMIAEDAMRCPPLCPPTSPLNP